MNTLHESSQIPIPSFRNMALTDNFIPSPSSSLNHMLALNEEEALDIILSKSVDKNNTECGSKTNNEEEHACDVTRSDKIEDSDVKSEQVLGNSLYGKSAWSDGLEHAQSTKCDVDIRPSVSRQSSVRLSDVSSYNALLESYTGNAIKLDNTPDLKSIWENFCQQLTSGNEPEELDSSKPEV